MIDARVRLQIATNSLSKYAPSTYIVSKYVKAVPRQYID